MPRTDVPVQALSSGANAVITRLAADATNDHELVNNGQVSFYVENDSGGVINVTVIAVACSHGRTTNDTFAVANGTIHRFGPYPPEEWNQSNGRINIDIDVDTTSFIYAIGTP